ncbi:MAG: HlyD family secretion protein, partial [Rhodobacteraceae bacterium]|nr:HlyD family secretion protein [Paracoccaceae bacterium]
GGRTEIAVDSHPSVQAALVARNQAAYALSRTKVVAPKDGIVYQAASFRAGQVVGVGQPLFSFVVSNDVWVEANFKETQLGHIRVGQPAEVTLDSNPARPLSAVVDAIGAGTGAEFSLLPAQNATGNWVKVTQRVPVRLRLTAPFAAGDGVALASGLSAEVSVDTGHRRGLRGLLPRFLGGR